MCMAGFTRASVVCICKHAVNNLQQPASVTTVTSIPAFSKPECDTEERSVSLLSCLRSALLLYIFREC